MASGILGKQPPPGMLGGQPQPGILGVAPGNRYPRVPTRDPQGGILGKLLAGMTSPVEKLYDISQGDYSPLGVYWEDGTGWVQYPEAGIPFATEMAGLAATGGLAAPAVRNATGMGVRSTVSSASEPFSRWFRDSYAVDDAGQPLTVYHGSNRQFSEFKPTPSMRQVDPFRGPDEVTSPAYFFTPNKKAAQAFAEDRVLVDKNLRGGRGGKARVRDFHLSVQNPLDLVENESVLGIGGPNPDAAEVFQLISGYDPPQYWHEVQQMLDDPDIVSRLRAEGYDGVRLREADGSESWAVFDPSQIKSASKNRGTYDPDNPNVYYSHGLPLPAEKGGPGYTTGGRF